ncbi:Alpha-1,4 glucan phosphorylase L isozyme, chloroplastic/amyloplastic [Vitis vinifera]|uniref:Alpha-1,4 glucan phosphorylase n=1 Tax=Vitis vinifera TaxID=29760 RepID=A0A438D4T4_VITVI|nr:Alpha-1,4 glucan phosphorylase L isozyme, chloroplastic/amyloplastic [Vitis vinifera]
MFVVVVMPLKRHYRPEDDSSNLKIESNTVRLESPVWRTYQQWLLHHSPQLQLHLTHTPIAIPSPDPLLVASVPGPPTPNYSSSEIPPLLVLLLGFPGPSGTPVSLTADAACIVSSIKYHAEFTPLFSPEQFELPKAFFATAQSVRDALIINWNATYDYHEKMNFACKILPFQRVVFFVGRALLNAIGNLELTGAYAEALRELGKDLENVARQEPDAALGNGGLGRLASCFLDSLATLNYPAWVMDSDISMAYLNSILQKMAKRKLLKIGLSFSLQMGNPWEIVRNDVSYPVKFYGKVIEGSDGKRHWIGGEDIIAIAYDVPIPGYKTKTTINLRLWSTKVQSDDFDLYDFNAGNHTKACEAQLNAEKICYILYPGDDSMEGKVLRLKQQYTLCSASLQDIIARFERRSGGYVNWEEFPEKVAVQMNDTHPTLCIPELMRILMDLKGMSWKEAWKITQRFFILVMIYLILFTLLFLSPRTVAYTNHTVLPEALEKWSLELMQKLLPRHVEIIEMIDEELINTIISEYGTADPVLLEKKLKAMRILENVDFPASVKDLLVQPEESSVVEPGEEIQSFDEEVELIDEEEELIELIDEEEEFIDEEEEPTGKGTQKKKVLSEPVPEPPKMVRMANLCVVGGHAVNGVAEIHSEIVKDEVFNDFFKVSFCGLRNFKNKTNGVTPRRWIRFCNPDLSEIITKWIHTEDWVLNTEKLSELRKFADDEELHAEWRAAKRSNKMKIELLYFQVKRIHEYKRQLLNILGIVYRYKKMKEMTAAERKAKFVPRVCIFGGKAFATYVQAKRIVKFITDVGTTVNHDSEIGDLLKV